MLRKSEQGSITTRSNSTKNMDGSRNGKGERLASSELLQGLCRDGSDVGSGWLDGDGGWCGSWERCSERPLTSGGHTFLEVGGLLERMTEYLRQAAP
jgi:hypothetical protein